MTALAASSISLAGPSQPPSQSSSPASPTAGFSAAQQAAIRSVQAHLRSASRPGTPVGGPPLEPPAGVSFSEFLSTWSDAHVARWLAALDPHGKCSAHAPAFRAADVRGGVLLELDQASLREIGITSIGDRIRILNAVKALRMRCSTRAAATNGIYGAGGHAQGASVSSLASSNGSSASPKVTVNGADPRAHSPQLAAAQAQAQHRNRSRPAPLQLRNAAQADLPRLIRDAPAPPDSARAALGTGPSTPVRPLPNPTQTGQPSTSASGRLNLPPVPPVPRNAPPLPPTASSSSRGQPPRLHALATQQAGRRTPTQVDGPPPPSYAPPPVPAPSQESPASHLTPNGGGWKGEYGLPSGPRSGSAGRATSPLPSFGRRSPSGAHTKAPSYSAPSSAPAKPAPRPSTTGTHPYGGSNGTLQPPQQQQPGQLALSPIAESFISQSQLATPTTLSPATAGTASTSSLSGPTSASSAPSAYQVGRGPFRPSTPSGSVQGAPTIAELKRRLVRFHLTEDGHSAIIDVAECANGVEVLERVLRKFGKLSANITNVDDLVSADDGGLCIDGWAVYLDFGHTMDGPAKPLREAELLSLCSSYDHPYRDSGLTIRRTGKPRRAKVLQQIFGDSTPGTPYSTTFADEDASIGHLGNSVQFPRSGTPSQEKDKEKELRNMKRASSISVLSGLGVRDPERVLDARVNTGDKELNEPQPKGETASGKSPSSTTFAGRIRTFLGARPPSELIATHLPAYFPYTQPKVLRRTVRQSMRFSSGGGAGRRDSAISVATLAQHQAARRASRRVSTASRLSADRRVSMASIPPPPVPEKGAAGDGQEQPPRVSLSTSDGQSVDLEEEAKSNESAEKDAKQSSSSTPHLLPPVNFPSESFADAFQSVTGSGANSRPGSGATPPMSRSASSASWRFSYMNELRARRDRSDTASMLTVDEITAEVANRRKSTVPSVRSSIMEGDGAEGVQAPQMDEQEEDTEDEENFEIIEDEEELEEMEEEDELEDEFEEDEEDDETTLADEDDDAPVKSTGGKRGYKWIRGALIGAGSFGSVYLGMDAMNGLLMAVKQVELPSGSGPNEQRKKSMLDALEREIDLLRELQHENIVQYLDSSSDDTHLNIFLEYVPGGSVTALLRSYGAFEEALCRHFVRQILQGLNYLHERDIIHRDIKGANILVDNKGGIKISDFGISKKVEETFLGSGARVHRPSLQGSVYWMAPEVVKQLAHTRKADIWSVGCLVVEMLTGNHPYPTLNQMQAIFKIGSSAKPSIPSDISPEAEDFLAKTFEIDYDKRPGADELLQHPWIVKGPSTTTSTQTSTTPSKPSSTKSKASKIS